MISSAEDEAKINSEFYSRNSELCFKTRAMGKDYQEAFAEYLYKYLVLSGIERPRILEVGANSTTFEEGVYKRLRHLDSENGTDFAESTEYTILDISNAAMDKAEESADQSSIFSTVLRVGDVTKGIPGSYDVIIANELLDDLGHDVIAKIGGKTYYVKHEVRVSYAADPIAEPLWPVVIRVSSYEETDCARYSKYSDLIYMMENGRIWSFSENVDKAISNMGSALNKNGLLWLHDYGMLYPAHRSYSNSIRRVFTPSIEGAIESIKNGNSEGYQITSDVNFIQIALAVSASDMHIVKMEDHDAFVWQGMGKLYISSTALAAAISNMSEARLKYFQSALHIREIGNTLLSMTAFLNSYFSNAFEFSGGRILPRYDAGIDLSRVGDAEAARELYDAAYIEFYSKGVRETVNASPLMDIAAIKHGDADFTGLLRH